MGHAIAVASAGTRAAVGAPMDPAEIALLSGAGVTPTPHAGRQLTTSGVADADLVLAATRSHRAAVVRLHPPALRYTFTVVEITRLAALVDPLSLVGTTVRGTAVTCPGEHPAAVCDLAAQRLAALVRAVAARRGTVAPHVAHGEDLLDPVGGTVKLHAAVAEQIEGAVEVLLRRLDVRAQGPACRVVSVAPDPRLSSVVRPTAGQRSGYAGESPTPMTGARS